jgi:hypothetical protein
MPRKRRHFIRTGHGAGEGQPHVEVPRDGMPKPVAAPEPEPTAPLVFRQGHKIADSETAKEMGRRGGLKRAANARSVVLLGKRISEDSAFADYRASGEDFLEIHSVELAKLAGGKVSSGPMSMAASAALQLSGSRFCFDKFAATGEPSWLKLGSALANDSRQNLLAAYSHAVLESESRSVTAEDDPFFVSTKGAPR